MAAELAAQLLEKGLIDFVLCFSPSIAVSEGIQKTFSWLLNRRFDGVIGAIGSSFTYQSMTYFEDDFWQILDSNRVLVVFDEIHHCGGTTYENANRWGQQIILRIQSRARYTLALTGTPWRSDQSPIVLSQYIGEQNNIQCDYVYGLKEAVGENVCRKPTLVLVDNEKISVTDEENSRTVFSSFQQLLSDSLVSYQSIINDTKAIEYILGRGCKKLAEIRVSNPDAGGLVVASSIEHAVKITRILKNMNQSAVMVSYKQDQPLETINSFRHNDTQWIVSIGMVAEGTDIPRLQVCCHLSRIKTELYFRQVLGRILRVNHSKNQEAWLYTFSEPTLSNYATRIEEELPDVPVIIRENANYDLNEQEFVRGTCSEAREEYTLSEGLVNPIEISQSMEFGGSSAFNSPENQHQIIDMLGLFRERVIATFDSPFSC